MNMKSNKPYQILNEVSEVYGVPVALICSEIRHDYIVTARQVAMYLLRMETDCTLDTIGCWLGGRTPATISFGFQKIADLRKKDNILDRQISNLVNRLGA